MTPTIELLKHAADAADTDGDKAFKQEIDAELSRLEKLCAS